MAFNLAELGQILNAGAGAVNNYRQQRSLADLGANLQTGDYKTAARTALAAGDVHTGLSLLNLGQKQDELRQQKEADAQAFGLAGVGGVTLGPSAAPAPAGGNLPRGIRNMNPGNIEAGGFAQSQPGFVGSDGRFAKFDTLEHGVGAQAALLGRYADKGINTVAGVINRWAPQAENGAATGNYANFVAQKLGVDPNAPIDLKNPETRTALAYAMGEFENGRPIAPQDGGRPVQVADASGAIPQSSGGVDQTETRIQNITRALSNPRISPNARQILSLQLQEAERRRSESRQDADRAERRQERLDNRTARQEELALKRQEHADKFASEAAARNEKLTESQAKSGVYYTESKASHDLLSDPKVMIGGVGLQGSIGRSLAAIPGVGQNIAPETTRNFNQAADNFVSNVVYAKSGASATAAEYDRAFRQYIPAPTDGTGQIKQKAEARSRWLDQQKISAGPAVKDSGGGASTPKATGGGTSLPAGWSVKVH